MRCEQNNHINIYIRIVAPVAVYTDSFRLISQSQDLQSKFKFKYRVNFHLRDATHHDDTIYYYYYYFYFRDKYLLFFTMGLAYYEHFMS